MPIENPSDVFPQVEKLVYGLAWNFSRRYNIPFEDTRSEASVAFMKACRNYKEGKGMKFSSWCHLVVWGGLKSYVMRRAEDRLVFVEINDDLLGEDERATAHSRALELREAINYYDGIGEIVLSLLQESPHEILSCYKQLGEDGVRLMDMLALSPRRLPPGKGRGDQVEEILEALKEETSEERALSAWKEVRAALSCALAV